MNEYEQSDQIIRMGRVLKKVASFTPSHTRSLTSHKETWVFCLLAPVPPNLTKRGNQMNEPCHVMTAKKGTAFLLVAMMMMKTMIMMMMKWWCKTFRLKYQIILKLCTNNNLQCHEFAPSFLFESDCNPIHVDSYTLLCRSVWRVCLKTSSILVPTGYFFLCNWVLHIWDHKCD